jgi:hypothetical protein
MDVRIFAAKRKGDDSSAKQYYPTQPQEFLFRAAEPQPNVRRAAEAGQIITNQKITCGNTAGR